MKAVVATVVCALLLLGIPVRASALTGCDRGPLCNGGVEADDDADAIIGRGQMVFPRTYAPTSLSRQGAAECEDCEWRIEPLCAHGQGDGACPGATVGCPDDAFRMRVLVRRPGTAWDQAGVTCLGGAEQPVPVADVAGRVRDTFVDGLPQPEPSMQPPDGGVTNLPVVVRSGQRDGARTTQHTLLGLPVEVTARPTWTWRWGDGTEPLRTTDAGSRWPDTAVSHVYRRPGRYPVTVTASWTGDFTVDGLGPFAVAGGPVTQEAGLTVVVRDAPAELVG